jgi:hypothetical protein
VKPESDTSCARKVESIGKWENWTSTFPSELPFGELESRWTLESLRGDCRGQNPSNWGFLYIIGKLLELKYLEWAHMTHLDIWNTRYGQKKGRKLNCQFDSRPLKVRNRPDFLLSRWHATYCWKALDEGYNFAWDFISIGGLHTKVWPREVAKVPILGIFGTKWHLDACPMTSHRVYYKGEGDGFPQVQAVVSFVSSSLFVARLSTKSVPTMY